MRSTSTVWLSLLIASLSAACNKAAGPAEAPQAPASISKEGDRLVVALSESAAQRLGIEQVPVVQKEVLRVRRFAGDVRVPPGRSVVLAAPLTGRVAAVPTMVGASIAAGATLLTLSPLLSADSRASFAAMRVDAEGLAASAKAQSDGTELALQRAERMLRDGVGSERMVEEARVAREAAAATSQAATMRRDQLRNAIDGSLETLPITAPFAGVLRQLLVSDGQQVAAGAPLLEVADLSRLWIRVPVPVVDANSLDADAPVAFDGLVATRASAPPSGDSLTNTVDLWYEVLDAAGTLRPGQPVFVPVPIAEDPSQLVVPWSAVMRDERGDAFVYVVEGERRYARRAVQLRFVHEGDAAITGKLVAGDPVVFVGVQELWGIESGHAR